MVSALKRLALIQHFECRFCNGASCCRPHQPCTQNPHADRAQERTKTVRKAVICYSLIVDEVHVKFRCILNKSLLYRGRNLFCAPSKFLVEEILGHRERAKFLAFMVS